MNEGHNVETSYEQIAEQYLASKQMDAMTQTLLDALVDGVPEGAAALDLGCGAGVPVMQWLAQRFAVTGVDISARQLELAQQYVPTALLIKSDMAGLDFAASSFDIVTAFFSIIHVPRTEQPELVGRIFDWLKPGGRFLAPWAIHAWEGEEENWEQWGATMWWSHYGADANIAMLQDASFQILSADQHTNNDETWLWVLAQKPITKSKPDS